MDKLTSCINLRPRIWENVLYKRHGMANNLRSKLPLILCTVCLFNLSKDQMNDQEPFHKRANYWDDQWSGMPVIALSTVRGIETSLQKVIFVKDSLLSQPGDLVFFILKSLLLKSPWNISVGWVKNLSIKILKIKFDFFNTNSRSNSFY